MLRWACPSACLSVRNRIRTTAGQDFAEFSIRVACGRGAVLFWWRCDMLCISGFSDEVVLSCSGPCGSMSRP